MWYRSYIMCNKKQVYALFAFPLLHHCFDKLQTLLPIFANISAANPPLPPSLPPLPPSLPPPSPPPPMALNLGAGFESIWAGHYSKEKGSVRRFTLDLCYFVGGGGIFDRWSIIRLMK